LIPTRWGLWLGRRFILQRPRRGALGNSCICRSTWEHIYANPAVSFPSFSPRRVPPFLGRAFSFPGPSSYPYSPKCLEDVFSEVLVRRCIKGGPCRSCASGFPERVPLSHMSYRLGADGSLLRQTSHTGRMILVPGKRQTRCEAGAQSLRASLRERRPSYRKESRYPATQRLLRRPRAHRKGDGRHLLRLVVLLLCLGMPEGSVGFHIGFHVTLGGETEARFENEHLAERGWSRWCGAGGATGNWRILRDPVADLFCCGGTLRRLQR
jgi:hypothetical protein